MPNERVGGYFAELKLLTDEPAYKRGIAALKGVEHGLGQIVKWTAGLSIAKNVFSGWMALMQRDELILSKTTNLATGEVSAWSTAVGAAGVSAGQFTGALASLDSRLQRMKLGEVDVGLARALGMLGIGFGGFAKEDASARTRDVLMRASAMTDERKAAQLVADVLGTAGQEYFWYLKMSGENLDRQLMEARALTFTNAQTKKDAMIFGAELRKTGTALKEIGALFGSTFAREMTPVLKNINALIIANKGLIRTEVIKFAQDLGKAAREVVSWFERWVPRAIDLIGKLGGIEGIAHKVVIAFAAWQALHLVEGVLNLTKGIGGLMGILKAVGVGAAPVLFAFTALYLILDDLAAWSRGGGSVIAILASYFDKMLPKETKEDLAAFWKDMKTSIPAILKDLRPMVDLFKALTAQNILAGIRSIADNLTAVVDAIKTVVGFIKGISTGDWGTFFETNTGKAVTAATAEAKKVADTVKDKGILAGAGQLATDAWKAANDEGARLLNNFFHPEKLTPLERQTMATAESMAGPLGWIAAMVQKGLEVKVIIEDHVGVKASAQVGATGRDSAARQGQMP